ncbi:uncharacterized protein DNG_00059 [Cephalotrichum gorgonifer]|uniref:Uncharacterized protein n=1 Tax=Cephalotrichum gorgonifer TaxID=2041049 RepID=A0AAE8MN84_9PEZI|nr:uncharacterized protein DNG_00059 [Cephalotrichum gorgonifer]
MTNFTDLVDDVIFLLIEHIESEKDLSSLQCTTRHLHYLLTQPLYSRNVRLHGGVALHWAAEHDRVDTAQRLLEVGADIMGAGTGPGYEYPLFVAARYGSVGMVRLLLETEGVSPDWMASTVQDGLALFTTPLAMAARNGHVEVVRLLLDEPTVDPQRCDSDRQNGISYAVSSHSEAMVKLFLQDPRININRAGPFGENILLIMEDCRPRVAKIILDDPRLDLASVDDEGCTVLMQMMHQYVYNLHVVRMLLSQPGIDLGAVDNKGRTALIWAAMIGNPFSDDLINLLLADPRCNPDAVDNRRRRDLVGIPRNGGAGEELPALPSYPDADVLGGGLDFGNWDGIGAPGLDDDVIIPFIPGLATPGASASPQGDTPGSGNMFSVTPWFLQSESWALHHSNHDQACEATVELEPFIHAVKEMLQCWVEKGHNSFIHRRLYADAMPTCVQDAYTTLATYNSRTPAVRDVILQIADDRAAALINSGTPSTGAGGAKGILADLARVQALFVYVYIRLFDGSVRLRATAEQQLPTLRHWVRQMLKSARQYRGEDAPLVRRPLTWTAGEFESEYDAAAEMWRLWALTESCRRTHLVVDTIANTYQIMARRWAECTGGVMITGRKGLWEADSAVKWFEMCCRESPLLVPSLRPGPSIAEYAGEEFDEFVRVVWGLIVGGDKIRSWVERSAKVREIAMS